MAVVLLENLRVGFESGCFLFLIVHQKVMKGRCDLMQKHQRKGLSGQIIHTSTSPGGCCRTVIASSHFIAIV